VAETPASLARKIEKWAGAGFDYTTVIVLKAALEPDRRESAGRIHSRSGNLAKSVRVIEPTLPGVVRRGGVISSGLSAGSRSKSNPINYAGIIQNGGRVKPHAIRATGHRLAFPGIKGEVVIPEVNHPGATIRAQNYLQVKEPRLGPALDAGYQDSINREIA